MQPESGGRGPRHHGAPDAPGRDHGRDPDEAGRDPGAGRMKSPPGDEIDDGAERRPGPPPRPPAGSPHSGSRSAWFQGSVAHASSRSAALTSMRILPSMF